MSLPAAAVGRGAETEEARRLMRLANAELLRACEDAGASRIRPPRLGRNPQLLQPPLLPHC